MALADPGGIYTSGAVDVVTADPKHDKVEFENDQVRVVRYQYGPGEKSPMHGHPDNLQVVLTDTKVSNTTSDGKTAAIGAKAGEVHWRPAAQHAVENTGDKAFEGTLVEMKGAQ